jgi:hypothetical protein
MKTFLICIVLFLLIPGAVKADLTLANKGKSAYRIVIAAKAIPSERYAAEELQRYLERVAGVTLPIVTDETSPRSHEILLGTNAHVA